MLGIVFKVRSQIYLFLPAEESLLCFNSLLHHGFVVEGEVLDCDEDTDQLFQMVQFEIFAKIEKQSDCLFFLRFKMFLEKG